jgi:hypothetical protein
VRKEWVSEYGVALVQEVGKRLSPHSLAAFRQFFGAVKRAGGGVLLVFQADQGDLICVTQAERIKPE